MGGSGPLCTGVILREKFILAHHDREIHDARG